MQSITWSEMILASTHRPGVTLGESIVRTVSGRAPCDHCHAIEREKASEGEQLLDLLSKNILLAPLACRSMGAPPRPGRGTALPEAASCYFFLTASDLDPPPRV